MDCFVTFKHDFMGWSHKLIFLGNKSFMFVILDEFFNNGKFLIRYFVLAGWIYSGRNNICGVFTVN